MKSLRMRSFLAGIAIVALMFGCSDDSDTPTGPTRSIGLAPTAETGDCGAADYLTALSPVLAEWQDSLTSAFQQPFDDPPVFSSTSVVEDYLEDLAPVLQQWEMTINTTLDSAVVDTVPDFDGGSDSVPEYLAGLSDLLQQWRSALDTYFERSLLPATPIYQGDTDSPVIICPDDTTVTCADSSGIEVDFDHLIQVGDDCDTSPEVECDPASGSIFPLGPTLVTCTATDSVGNESECTFTVFVVDSTPPVITCPSDTTLECTGDGGAVLEFTAEATDECDPNPVVECDPPSGSTFSLGETVVTCTARDASGNSAECTFNVTVLDTTPPVLGDATATPNELWPPNHKMKKVTVSLAIEDICDLSPDCYIYDVTSDEAINGRGDGNTLPDWTITEDLTVKLRAERSGLGDGRTYTLHIRCEDDSGNSVERTVEVYVPHDRGHDGALSF